MAWFATYDREITWRDIRRKGENGVAQFHVIFGPEGSLKAH